MALEIDLSCPVCTELFRDPVLLSCGHSFCRRCINDLWTSSRSRNCSVCRQLSPQPPVSNLSLRNACDSYLREQNTKKDGGRKCQMHREMIDLFCQTDGKAICAKCKRDEHEWHVTLPLQQTVRQHKGKLKEALHSAEKTLLSLQNGTSRNSKIARYIKNYDEIMNRAKYTLPDAEALIDVPKHLGNLKYKVWEKMKDICPYYPVILNPNTAPADVVSVSDDLTSVSSCFRQQDEPNPVPLHRNRVVLGSVGYADGVHTWDIEVGKSRHWTLGVCLGLVKRNVEPLTPVNGFWGLRRDGDSYRYLTTGMSRLNVKRNPEIVRVKIEYYHEDNDGVFFMIFRKQKCWRKVRFSDARSDSYLAEFSRVPLENELFPFVIPEDQSVPLRVVPAKVILKVEQKLSFMDTHKVLILICSVFVVVIAMIMSWKIQH
ncbi:tripartite motif containing 35-1 isoform X2 [Pseudorasbora parva]|uniref:tripartite motif containing 35-1 isoform X2 n=1 Tax=Pseudorasbora parva TaxID=51549 RepID=UPI00351E5240